MDCSFRALAQRGLGLTFSLYGRLQTVVRGVRISYPKRMRGWAVSRPSACAGIHRPAKRALTESREPQPLLEGDTLTTACKLPSVLPFMLCMGRVSPISVNFYRALSLNKASDRRDYDWFLHFLVCSLNIPPIRQKN